MHRFPLPFFIFILLASCAPAPTEQATPTGTLTATVSATSPVPTTTPIPTPATPTSTAEVCDPLNADYCISDGHFIFQRPIKLPGNTFVDVTYRYASTANGTRDPHHGVEFLNKFGTPVHAAADGIVIFAGPDDDAIYSPWPNFYGNVIVIQHAVDRYTLYAHLSAINVDVNQTVVAGEKIGEVGQSGVATGSHLHFEVRRGDATDYFSVENPELWLVLDLGENGRLLGAIQIAIQNQKGQLVRFAEVTLQTYDDENQPIGNMLYSATYHDSMLNGQENTGMGDLPAGRYRIAMQYNGQLRERWVEVQSGKLTQVVFLVK